MENGKVTSSRSFKNRALGYLFRRYCSPEARLPDCAAEDLALYRKLTPFTMTSPERMCGLIGAVRYVVQNQIPGDIVECGVWRGGSMMSVAHTLLALEATDRHLHLFDTYAGMTAPSEKDTSRFGESDPKEHYTTSLSADGTSNWSFASLEEVKRNLLSTGYPADRIHFTMGPVEQTIPDHAPETISLLRLDTDFYASTKHEMEHLFPRLVQSGVLLLDDYGHWEGQRIAVDEYLKANKLPLLLSRLDYTGRIGVKS
jgi:O-methyltransferase